MPTTITKTIYTYRELDDRAKEKARDWYLRGLEFDWHAETVLDDAQEVGRILGIEIANQGKHTPDVYYSVGERDDYATYTGTYSYRKGSARTIREYAPTDTTLHRIADGLQQLQRRHFYGLSASISHGRTRIEVEPSYTLDRDLSRETCDTLEELLGDFAGWIESRLYEEHEYQTGEEAIRESMEANQYTFDAEGKREG